MAMYYYQGSSEIQADGLQTLYLMNPKYLVMTSSSETQNHPQPNTPFFNPLHPPVSTVSPHAPLPQQFIGIPLSHDPIRPSPSQEHIRSAAHNAIPRFHYNMLGGLIDHHHQHHHQSDYGHGNNLNDPNTSTEQQQRQQQTLKGLSLSLTPHQIGFDKSNIASEGDHDFPQHMISSRSCPLDPNLTTTSDHHSVESVIRGSKYLKAAQELLDEVVSVGNRTKRDKAKIIKESNGGGENDKKMNCGVELTIAQRQEIQMKKAKLNSMLYEVEQRYKHYHHEMQIIVTSLEQIAGTGSAKSYTHPARKTILKQFRCLKHTISAQIKALSKSLGEEENTAGGKMDVSRLKFIDHHLRQQRAFQQQQLGMMENNDAWRPKRGLPERAVSVLRAWLFDHFLHPYPKDSDKHTLAKQTGLTKGQVSNWFINARVRLWKPMVEDMYIEETKNQETSPEDNNTTKPEPRPDSQLQVNLVPISPSQVNLPEKNIKKPRNEKKHDHSPINILAVGTETKPGGDRTSKEFDVTFGRENYLSSSGFSSACGISVGELSDRFTYTDHRHQQIPSGLNLQGYHNNNFSLTLGLPPSETYSQEFHQQNNFLSHRSFEFGTGIEPVESTPVDGINSQDNASHPNISNYEILDFQKRKPFPAHLLPDHHFVA